MKSTNRRKFLGKGLAAAAAGGALSQTASAQEKPVKKVLWRDGKKPEKTPLFSSTVTYGNLLFIAGVGAHFEGDIKAHTKKVLDDIEAELKNAGSSMDKVLKANVYLKKMEDFQAMNEVYLGRFGAEPPVRTTIAAADIPGNSWVEIDVIAYI